MSRPATDLVHTASCEGCPLRTHGVCRALSAEHALLIPQAMVHRTFAAGTAIAHQDDANPIFAFIISGIIKLTRVLEDGRQQIVGLLSTSDFLGNLNDYVSHDNAECVTDVTLCCFPKGKFEAVLKNNPAFEHALLLQTMSELDDARNWILTLGQKRAGERIATFLLWLLEKQRKLPSDPTADDGPIVVANPFRYQEIGDFLGLTLETISRNFSKMRAAGVIARPDRRHVEVQNLEALRAMAKQEP